MKLRTKRAKRAAERATLAARARSVLLAAASPEFQTRVNAEVTGSPGDWIRDFRGMRKQVAKILDEMHVDHRHVELTFEWSPATRKLQVWAKPSPATVQTGPPRSKLRAIGPGEQPVKP